MFKVAFAKTNRYLQQHSVQCQRLLNEYARIILPSYQLRNLFQLFSFDHIWYCTDIFLYIHKWMMIHMGLVIFLETRLWIVNHSKQGTPSTPLTLWSLRLDFSAIPQMTLAKFLKNVGITIFFLTLSNVSTNTNVYEKNSIDMFM